MSEYKELKGFIPDELTGLDILKIKMQDNDANARTVGEYLIMLSQKCWQETEGFSGKRPFGNSGWDFEIYQALAAAGHGNPKWEWNNGEKELVHYEPGTLNKLINQAFKTLYYFVGANPQ